MTTVTVGRVLGRLLITVLMGCALGCIVATPFMPLFSLAGGVAFARSDNQVMTAGSKHSLRPLSEPTDHRTDHGQQAPLLSATQQQADGIPAKAQGIAEVEKINWFSIEQLLWTARISTVIPGIPSRIKTYDMYADLPQLVSDFRTLQYLDVASLLLSGACVIMSFVWIGFMLLMLIRKRYPTVARTRTATHGAEEDEALPQPSALPGRAVWSSDLDDTYNTLECNYFAFPVSCFLVGAAICLCLAARMLAKIYTTNYKLRGHGEDNSGPDETCSPLYGCIYSFASMGFEREVGWTLLVGAASSASAALCCQVSAHVIPLLVRCLCKRTPQWSSEHSLGNDGYGLVPSDELTESAATDITQSHRI